VAKVVLAVSGDGGSSWVRALEHALGSSSTLEVVSEREAWALGGETHCDLILLDAAAVSGEVPALVAHLRQAWPDLPIVVVATSLTWQRARQVLLAGASDYVRKSLDKETILTTLQEFL
jgi:DNA-binding NarL/FixJ family response regulator